MKPRLKQAMSLLVLLAVLLGAGPGAFGGPTSPIVSGSVATFTGDQSAGIWPESTWSCPPVYTFNIYDLDRNIAPSAGVSGIRLSHQAANGPNGEWRIWGPTDGGTGGTGGSLTVDFDSPIFGIFTSGLNAPGIFVSSAGGNGGNGGSAGGIWVVAGNGGLGGTGGTVTISNDGSIQTDGSSGIRAASSGGAGGNGGSATVGLLDAQGGNGGTGGAGGTVTVTGTGTSSIHTSGMDSAGILASSSGGKGGNGGWGMVGGAAIGGQGGVGGTGGPVTVTNSGGIHTIGDSSAGIAAESQGGNGGVGGDAGGAYGKAGAGGAGGGGLGVTVLANSSIETAGKSSSGIAATSQGGAGGVGGAAGGAYGKAGAGGAGGGGGLVTVSHQGSIVTTGESSSGIVADSRGGDGGAGYDAGGAYGKGGAGGTGGSGGDVAVNASGSIETAGDFSAGIFARSQGGIGGAGGVGGGAYGEGGAGGVGGSAGHVHVTTTGSSSITTMGAEADGISAQSLGGAGGNGGTGGGAVAQGGSALGSGPGGAVDIENSGDILTSGTDSRGIFAQSVGGGAGGVGTGGGVASWGGGANSAGDGGPVHVVNDGVITTGGSGSSSIMALSVGGGGGDAADSGGIVSLGGTGSAGGNGGAVAVTNTNTLKTNGDDAVGILAQSLGGGGGVGGGSGGFVAFGGDGNSSGDGGNVKVDNSGSITTTGANSDGIFAQSEGGGGGRGKTSGGVIIFGGRGGSGGSGGEVTVINNGSLGTSGFEAYGILAESLGGGGGRGGSVWGIFPEITMSVGGSSDGGGNGAKVDIDSGAVTVKTVGDFSHGIYGRSIGGGGGGGGNALSAAVGVEFSESMAIGGMGGEGGDGGIVDLTSDSHIITQGKQAHGLYAQSQGGGGGSGGNAINLSMTVGGVQGLPGVGIGLSIGGFGGEGGDGQAATITSTGNISTSGSRSYGAYAQSVGGGGGDGGNSVAGGLSFQSMVAEVAIGGFAGKGGAGNKASVDSAGSIDTQGDSAYGILAQSVGGGGGAGGNSIALTIGLPSLKSLLEQMITPKVSMRGAMGGIGGAGGAGGAAQVTNQGPITTQGALAHGILAQSIGGGGGAGGDDMSLGFSVIPNPMELLEVVRSFALDGGVKLGSPGGLGGDGGPATVHNSGDITTQEHFAAGILAQSVGGGGGVGGLSIKDKHGLVQTQVPSLKLERSAAGSGSGAAVTVDNSADITTHGGFAHGILAQSVGGGGGFAGIKEDMGVSVLDDCSTAAGVSLDGALGFGVGFVGSSGGSGSAGAVNVTHTGSITTLGGLSHGILAQSAGGSGTGGAVTVTLDGDVMAAGVDSDGVHAQSVGRGGRGKISVTVGGMVRGGSGAGAGVNLDGGTQNVLTNTGHISALSGTALRGSVGDDLIENYGTVFGDVHLGAGANAFNNYAGARFDTGATIDLGAGNALTNAGILSPGGTGIVCDTTLIGDLILSAASVLEMDIGGLTPGSFDSLNVTGTVTGDVGLLSFAPMMSSGMGGADVLSLAPAMGSINFSFLPGFDPASEIGPGGSMTLQFLTAGSPVDWTMMSYTFTDCPAGFRYDVFQQDGALFFQAVHTIPAPGALLLTGIGLGFLRWTRRRMMR